MQKGCLVDDEIDLRQYLIVLWRRRYTIAAITLTAVVAAALFSFLSSPTYESQALIQLSEHSATVYASPSTAAEVLTAPSFLDPIAKEFGMASGRELLKRVKVEPVRDTRMVRLKVRDSSAERARNIANAIASAFVARASERVEEKRKITSRRLESVNAQLAEIQRILELTRGTLVRIQQGGLLTGEDRAFVRAFTLNAMSISETLYSELRAAQRDLVSELLTVESPAIIEPPSLPSEPVAPRKVLNITLAAILGLMAGTMLAFVMEYFGAPTDQLAPSRAAQATPDPSHRSQS